MLEKTPDALPSSVEGLALFLDIDGTLIDIAPTPEEVVLPPGLPAALGRLSGRAGGALALVTGRSLARVEEMFPHLPCPIAGLHGSEWRDAEGRRTTPATTPAYLAARDEAARALAAIPGATFEDKGAAFAAHFRAVPEAETRIAALMRRAADAAPGWVLQAGKSVVELRAAGRSKGDALEAFMAAPPFAGRRPLAIGDDLTDEAMFAAANRLGGASVRVGLEGNSQARARIASPGVLRDWIERMAG